MSDEEIRAKVFISCGQRKEPDEVSVAQEIERQLKELHYDPYIAVVEQSPLGVKENIFRQLETSEYFLFIDFKREQLANEELCRGSLFSHQELAVASYLSKNLLAFQEVGLKKHDGLLGFLHINAIPFTDRTQLPDLVVKEIETRGWNPRWKDKLVLERETDQHSDTTITQRQREARYFHIIAWIATFVLIGAAEILFAPVLMTVATVACVLLALGLSATMPGLVVARKLR